MSQVQLPPDWFSYLVKTFSFVDQSIIFIIQKLINPE